MDRESRPITLLYIQQEKLTPPSNNCLSENSNDFINNFLPSQFITSFRSKEPSSFITTSCTNIADTPTVLFDTQKNAEEDLGHFKYNSSQIFVEKRGKIMLRKYQGEIKFYFQVTPQLPPDNPVGKLLSHFKKLFKLSFVPGRIKI